MWKYLSTGKLPVHTYIYSTLELPQDLELAAPQPLDWHGIRL